MAIDFPTSPTAGQVYSYNGVAYVYTAQGVWATAGASAVGIIGGSPQGRLTLQTGTPVMTTTQSAKTTIYYTPYVGNRVPIYDGTNMVMTTFAELSVATTDTTKSPAAIGASKVNDWFVWSDAGTLRLGHGPDWTNDITRSAGTALTMVQGVLLNNAAITNGPAASRGTYVGTTRSNASSQLDWIFGALNTAAFLNLWNAYNRVSVAIYTSYDAAATWSYSSTTVREVNGATSMEIRFVRGLDEDGVLVNRTSVTMLGATGTLGARVGIGFDVTTAHSAFAYNENNVLDAVSISYANVPGLGYHFYAGTESINGTGTITFLAQTCNLSAILKA